MSTAYEISTHSTLFMQQKTDNKTKTDRTIRSIVSNFQSESKRKKVQSFWFVPARKTVTELCSKDPIPKRFIFGHKWN